MDKKGLCSQIVFDSEAIYQSGVTLGPSLQISGRVANEFACVEVIKLILLCFI